MDLTLTDDQQAIAELAHQILTDACTPEHLKAVERASGEDPDLHRVLVEADLLGLGLPEEAGGAGLGLLDAALVVEAVGRSAAPVPVLDCVAAGRALAAVGDGTTRRVAAGDIVRVALREGPDGTEPGLPVTQAAEAAGGTVLRGTKIGVGGPLADEYLVSAAGAGGVAGLYLVEAAAVTAEASTSSTGAPVFTLTFDDAPAHDLGAGPAALRTLRRELAVLRCAQQAGVVRGALDLAAQYCAEREQFGSKIGTFQAVAHRLADAWIDANAIEMTWRQAAWRIDNGLPADQAVASAAYWACEGGHRVVHAAQHVHGGIGVDTDYPVHRFFRWEKATELALGSGSRNALALGAALVDEPLTIG